MKAKEITFSIKQGLPNYGSVATSITYQVEDGDTLKAVWKKARKEAIEECYVQQAEDEDPSWINEKQPNE